MLHDQLLIVLVLLLGIAFLTMISNRLRISYPILIVISGLVISLIPGIPLITLHPDLVFLIFLPPLLYRAAWDTSWKEFWKMKRPISLLAFGCVIFTSAIVALVSHAIIPNFPLAYGFLLGGIISPPDAIAATSVLKGLKVPKRILTILEGESLVNDASSLIVFRFALAAILTGQFNFLDASKSFAIVVVLGILIGLVIANIVYAVHRFFPTTPSIDASITLITPYIMYITAEYFHVSGVLSVVSGGLFLTYRSNEIFNYETRLYTSGLWDTVTFLLNGFVFILIGLQLPHIINSLGDYSVWQAITYGVIISILTIVIRMIWVFPGAYLPRMIFKSIREKETRPTWPNVFLVAWSGMRGVVSLASALAIPLYLPGGAEFPNRNLILFITFVVILITLVGQGLSLRPLIRMLNIQSPVNPNSKSDELKLRIHLAESVLAYLDTNYSNELASNEAYSRVRDRYERMINIARKNLQMEEPGKEEAFLPHYRRMLIEIIHVRRRELTRYSQMHEVDEDLVREKEWELDLEEARLRN